MQFLEKYDWLLFDLDNTLLDFTTVSKKAFAQTLLYYNEPVHTNSYKKFSEINAKYWHYYEKRKISAQELRVGRFTAFFESENIKANPKEASEKYLSFLVAYSKLITGAKQILKQVNTTHKLAVITNGLADVQHQRLEKHELKSFFEHIFISQEMEVSKPNKEYFEKVYEQIGKPQKYTVLVIGDNPETDIKGGNKFGFHTCYFQYDTNKHCKTADYTIKSWINNA